MQRNSILRRGIALGCLMGASWLLMPVVSRGQAAGRDTEPPTPELLQLPSFDVGEPPAPQNADDTASDETLEAYIGPQAIERVAPNYPQDMLAARRDGWVALSFIISPEGHVTDAMVEDSSGIPSLETAALKAIEKWRYRPATLNGTPVEQTMTRTIIRFQLDSEDAPGARQSFASKYKKTNEMIQKHDLEHARAMLDDLESAGRFNLYEDAWFWWLKYTYMETAGTFSVEERRDTLHRAIGYDADYLPADILVVASVRLFNLETAAFNYAGALDAADRLKGSKTAKSSQNYREAVAALDSGSVRIRNLVNGDSTVEVAGRISSHDYWVHGLLRWSFSIGQISGRLDLVELRCARGSARYAAVTTQHTWTVPRSWGSCGAYIKGEPGTTFVVYEHPNKS